MAVWPLLAMLEREPDVMGMSLGIPESGDRVPDVLDEALWELRWLMTMQDLDGGVYHKLTTATFVSAPTPADDDATRYVVVKTSQSTLAAAAVFAQAARVLAPYAADRPGLADSLATAAARAWAWGPRHPSVYYDQAALNAAYDPDVTTGAYEDGWAGDEAKWAAAELFLLTGRPGLLGRLPAERERLRAACRPTTSRRCSATSTCGTTATGSPGAPRRGDLLATTLALADQALAYAVAGPVPHVDRGRGPERRVPLGQQRGPRAHGAAVLPRLDGHRRRRLPPRRVDEVDYLLGRNAVGISFVTGHGTCSPQAPHHSMTLDAVAAPIPGYVVGGPNPGQQDGCPGYPSALPARSYQDVFCSYASNEVAINWQGALVAGLAAAEALDYSRSTRRRRRRTRKAARRAPGSALDTVGPTPTRGRLHVWVTVPVPATVTVDVLDVRGRRVASASARAVGRVAADRRAGRGPAPGVYLVRVSTGPRRRRGPSSWSASRPDRLGLARDALDDEHRDAPPHLGLVGQRERQLVGGQHAEHDAQERRA